MAFITLEDLVGTVEVVVFPRDYERNAALIETDSKVFIMGNVSAEDDKASKLICEKIVSFDQVPRELWIQFADRKQYEQEVAELYATLRQSDGSDHVVVYLRAEKQMKHLPASRRVELEDNLLGILRGKYGAENVKVVEKSIEKQHDIIRVCQCRAEHNQKFSTLCRPADPLFWQVIIQLFCRLCHLTDRLFGERYVIFFI